MRRISFGSSTAECCEDVQQGRNVMGSLHQLEKGLWKAASFGHLHRYVPILLTLNLKLFINKIGSNGSKRDRMLYKLSKPIIIITKVSFPLKDHGPLHPGNTPG